jgi:cytochrome c oxidase cbb3-type subunit 3
VNLLALLILRSPFSFRAASLLGILLWVAAGAPTGAQDRSPQPSNIAENDSAEARMTFGSFCAGCHGLDGRGGERGPNIATRPEAQRLSDQETLRTLRDGRPANGMPAFSSLGDAKLAALLQHLRSLQGQGRTHSSPGDGKIGKQLFFGKAQCSQCHTMNGEGGFLGADLSAYALSHDASEIREAILEPYKNLDPRARIVNVTTHTGTQFSGVARNEDNFSLQLLAPDGTFYFFAKQDVAHIDYEHRSYMPSDYGTKLSKQELANLISYLLSVAGETKAHKANAVGAETEDCQDFP